MAPLLTFVTIEDPWKVGLKESGSRYPVHCWQPHHPATPNVDRCATIVSVLPKGFYVGRMTSLTHIILSRAFLHCAEILMYKVLRRDMLNSEEFLSQLGRNGSELMPRQHGVKTNPRHQEKLALVVLERQGNAPRSADEGAIPVSH